MSLDDDDFSDYDEKTSKGSIQFNDERTDGKTQENDVVFKEVFDARITPGDNEKLGLLTAFQAM